MNDFQNDKWVDDRLASLDTPRDWQPNAVRARGEIRRREAAPRPARSRWTWAAGTVAVAYLALIALPTRGTCAQRLWGGQCPLPAAAASTVKPVVKKNFKDSGRADAPIVCEIYSDYECPACAAFFIDKLPGFVNDYVATGKVRLIHRDFPLPMHPYASLAARYANAAGELGKYDIVTERLFRTQAEWSRTGNVDASVAGVLSAADMQAVRQLVAKDAWLNETVAEDVRMATADQINQTPSLVVVWKGRRQTVAPILSLGVIESYLNQLR